jgi:rhodanese-related sulfurtransferase
MDASNVLRDLSPAEIRQRLADRSIMLIDVREPDEHRAEHIHGALLYPLSTFDPGALPLPGTAEIVFHCGSGKRSAMAVGRCLEQGLAHTAHMAGGIQAWKAAGLPVVQPDAARKT